MWTSKLCIYFIFIIQILIVDNRGSGDVSACPSSGSSSSFVSSAGYSHAISITRNETILAEKATTAEHSDFLRAPPIEPRGDSEFNYLITGGYTTQDGSLVKFAVWVSYKNVRAQFGDNMLAGGVIIHKQFILTAAHILYSGLVCFTFS